MAELTWQSILKSQQQDFIKRLKFIHDLGYYYNDFIRLNTLTVIDESGIPVAGFNSEIIDLCFCDEHEIKIDNFCWELVNKYDDKYSDTESQDLYLNYKIGKLGEEAVKEYLGGLVNEIDYNLYDYGDDGIDFRLVKNKNIKIQVKTSCLRRISNKYIYKHEPTCEDVVEILQSPDRHFWKPIDNSWSINLEERNKNNILICVLFLNPVDYEAILDNSYRCLMAGFTPIKNNSSLTYKINELLYMGGIRGYLESLK